MNQDAVFVGFVDHGTIDRVGHLRAGSTSSAVPETRVGHDGLKFSDGWLVGIENPTGLSIPE